MIFLYIVELYFDKPLNLMSKHPQYAYLNGNPVYPPDYLGTNTKFFNFVFQADYKSLEKVCDSWFNIPSQQEVHYEPLLDKVIVTFANYESEKSICPPYDQHGYVPYKELIISFFVARTHKILGITTVQSVCAFVPYIFLDNMIPTLIGREVYGLPKIPAWIDFDMSNEIPSSFTVDAMTLKTFSATTPAQRQNLLSLKKVTNNNEFDKWEDEKQAFREIKKLLLGGSKDIVIPSVNLLVELGEFIFEQKMPFASLKQIRSIEDSSTASYQAIVEYDCQMKKFSGAGLIKDDYEISFTDNALFPIHTDLGLALQGQKPLFSFWLNWDFSFLTGKEVWKASTR
jgi:hypothetical protein